jgi:AcrR family transcriptional regulator
MSIKERQREEKERRRQSIIDAAEQVLGEKPRGEVTMSDIADTARLSRSLLYVYFEDMEDIFFAVTLRGFRALRSAFEEAVAQHEVGLMKIRAIGEAYIRFAENEEVYFELVAQFESRAPASVSDGSYYTQCLSESDRVMQTMTDAIRTGIGDGSIRDDLDPARTAVILWGYTHGLIQLRAHKGSMLGERLDVDPETLMDHALDFAGVALSGHCECPAPTPPAALRPSSS